MIRCIRHRQHGKETRRVSGSPYNATQVVTVTCPSCSIACVAVCSYTGQRNTTSLQRVVVPQPQWLHRLQSHTRPFQHLESKCMAKISPQSSSGMPVARFAGSTACCNHLCHRRGTCSEAVDTLLRQHRDSYMTYVLLIKPYCGCLRSRGAQTAPTATKPHPARPARTSPGQFALYTFV